MNLDEFRSLLNSFEQSAFRYEGLPEYEMSDEDRETVRKWKDGEPPPDYIARTPWQEKVRNWTAQGRQMQRVRLLEAPMTDYLCMSVEWWYPHNIAAGEETLGLDVATYAKSLPSQDYWLFDNSTVVLMNYDANGRFLSVDGVPNDRVAEYVGHKSRLLAAAGDLRVAYDRLLAHA